MPLVTNEYSYFNTKLMMNKKFFLCALMVLLAGVICVFAKSSAVWSGSFDAQNWGAWQEINFSDPVAVGDTVVFKGDVSEKAQIQIDDKNWAQIDGPYADFSLGVYKLVVTGDNLNAINGGIYVKGQNFTLKSVEVLKKSSDDSSSDNTSSDTTSGIEYQSLPWSGSFDPNNWNSQLALQDKELKAGDKLIFSGSATGSYAQLQVATPDFSTFFTKGDYNLVDFSNGSYTLTVDANNAALLDSGFVVKGQNFILSSVTVEKAPVITYQTLPWSGSFDANSWNSQLALKGVDLAVGDKITFTGTASDYSQDSPAQLQVATPDFSTFFTKGDWNLVDFSNGSYTLSIDDAATRDLLDSGFVVKGQHFTLTSVTVEKAPVLTFEELPWMGSFDPNGWNSVLALKDENLKVGDKLVFVGDASASTEDAPSQIQVAAPDFSVFLTTDHEKYNDFDGNFTLEVTDDNVDLLRSGFVVKGQSYTLQEVRVVSSISTKINAVSGDHREQAAYYNLMGQRMAQPKGICILHGKKIIQLNR